MQEPQSSTTLEQHPDDGFVAPAEVLIASFRGMCKLE